jgi:rare lipoprotein A
MAQRGVATWYGPGFEDKITRCGQVYHQSDLSAASNDLPCGTLVEVTNERNNQTVLVPITDTGAFRHPDILDLSRGAFARLAETATGVIPIQLAVRSLPLLSR